MNKKRSAYFPTSTGLCYNIVYIIIF